MFSQIIDSTHLSNPAINEISKIRTCGNIHMEGGVDVTLLSTLRAILPIEAEMALYPVEYPVGTGDGIFSFQETLGALCRLSVNEHCECIPGLGVAAVESHMLYNELASKKEIDGWVRVEKISVFYNSGTSICCFVNEEEERAIYLIDSYAFYPRDIQRIQLSLPLAMPWFFPTKESITTEIVTFLNTLQCGTPDKYIEAINIIAETKFNYRKIVMETGLKGYEFNSLNQTIAEAERQIEDIQHQIDNHFSLANTLIENARTKKLSINALKRALASGQTEDNLMHYFLENEDVEFIDIQGDEIEFTIKTYASIWDENEEDYVEDTYWAFYKNGFSSPLYSIAKAIFKDKSIKLKMCAAFKLGGSSYTRTDRPALRNYNFGFSDYLPNPHLNEYSCMNAWKCDIGQAILNNDFVFAVEVCKAATANLTLSDSTVMEKLHDYILRYKDKKIFELPTGESVNLKDALSYLNITQEV